MLQLYKTPPLQIGDSASSPENSAPGEMSFGELFSTAIGFLRRQYIVIVCILPLTVGIAAAYLYTAPRQYTAAARILMDTDKVQVFKQSILGDDPVNLAMVDSQIQILKSDSFGLSIVKDLHLAEDPKFVESGRGLVGKIIGLLINPFGSRQPKTESGLIRGALLTLENRLTVSRLGTTYVIEIQFQSINPNRAAEIANAIADAFIVEQVKAKYETIGRATAWLQDRLNELRAQVSAADHAVIDYKAKHNIVDMGGKLINDQQLTELNTALVKARADTVEAKARLDRVSQIMNADDVDPAAAGVATVADALHNEIILKLRQQYLDLAQRETLLSARLGHEHLAVVSLSNQMREIHRSILDEFRRIAESYKSEYDIAKAREASLEASLSTTVVGSQSTSNAQVQLRQLESTAQSYRMLYDTFQQRYADSVQQQSFPMIDARVITRALPPSQSSSPKSARILAVATFGGLALGFGLALLREITDRVFRTANQVESLLKTECLALLPTVSATSNIINEGETIIKEAKTASARIISRRASLLWYVVEEPLSRYTEALRSVKIAMDIGSLQKRTKVIGITSSVPNEGKSTFSASFAQHCANAGARVILLDCDLRKPWLSRDLAPHAAAGVIEVVTEAASLDQVIWSEPLTRLSFLPVVVRSRLTHTSEILASSAMKRFFDRLREEYDYVIVDLPPLAPVVDVRSAANLVDSFLLVVEWGKTKIDVVEHALYSARGVYDNMFGVVLNKVDFKLLRRYETNREQYYADSYYAHYGSAD